MKKLTKTEIELLKAYKTVLDDYRKANPVGAAKIMENIKREQDKHERKKTKDGK